MKVKSIFQLTAIIFIIGFMQVVQAQNSKMNNLTKQTLYSLKANEEVLLDEYFVESSLAGYKYALVIENTKTEELTFIFNGKRIAATKDYRIDVSYLDPTKDNGYSIAYTRKEGTEESTYVYINGEFEGNYDDAQLFSENGYAYKLAGRWYEKIGSKITGPYIGSSPNQSYNGGIDENGKYVFSYLDNERWFLNINGKVFGPFENYVFPIIADDEFIFSSKYREDFDIEKYKVNINSEVFGPYQGVMKEQITNSGKFAYSYKLDEKWFVNINGKIHGPYQETKNINITENGSFTFDYKLDGKRYININNNQFGPYEWNDYDYFVNTITEEGKFAFDYFDDGKYYTNINGHVFGPYKNQHRLGDGQNFIITKSGDYSFCYKSAWDECFINISGKVYGPYNDIKNVNITEYDRYLFLYKNNGKEFVNINGKVYGSYNDIKNVKITENGRFAFSYEKDGKYYANINGKVVGPYPYILSITIDNFGNHTFLYKKNYRLYKNSNGKEVVYKKFYYKPDGYEGSGNSYIEINSPDSKHTLFSRYEYPYVVIDGRKIGKSPAMRAWYDETKNAFIWNAVEDKDLVVYEYKL